MLDEMRRNNTLVQIPATMFDMQWITEHGLGNKKSRFFSHIVEMDVKKQLLVIASESLRNPSDEEEPLSQYFMRFDTFAVYANISKLLEAKRLANHPSSSSSCNSTPR